MSDFNLSSNFSPAGDQKEAISSLCDSISNKNRYQTLVGVTGSGKTFTMANVIKKTKMPTLIMTHNKTLAAQLYSEFKLFFPNNHVEYFISYYDYYQPEAYIARQDLYIEKDSSINKELERLRVSSSASLLEFDDVIVIASVSAIYGLGSPVEYKKMVQILEVNQEINQRELMLRLIDMGYSRDDKFFDRGNFRVNGDVVDIYLAYLEREALRVEFFGDEIETIYLFDVLEGKKVKEFDEITIYAANQFIASKDVVKRAIKEIEIDLEKRLEFFKSENKMIEYNRLKTKTEFDLEMLAEVGTCKGVENYSRYLSGKKEGDTPYSLLDYFESKGEDYLVIVDESHVSLPQFRAMYAGDRSRKESLVEYGFRLPSALDNRPLQFDEFINKAPAYLFVSATPSEFELNLSKNIAKQIVRPTGLLEPTITIEPIADQVGTLFDEIKEVIAKNQRVLITVLTKKMAEELNNYYLGFGIKCEYMHSDIDAIERNQIIRDLREGKIDVLIGINLLREGLDIPEVSLVAILDADKEGFLRSETALIQTIGRAARNVDARVILFADKITNSIQRAIDVTDERREIQEAFNKKHNITPTSVTRALDENLKEESNKLEIKDKPDTISISKTERKDLIKELNKQMIESAKNLEFEEAIRLRDEIERLKKS